jgi:hypothetical protein
MYIFIFFRRLAVLSTFLLTLISAFAVAIEEPAQAKVNDGVLTWTSGAQIGQEVALFGVNYAVPFAYSYRALKKRGIDHKTAIDMDVAHIARLGLDAYRVHIWDRQISDSQGNLVVNEHLELFDYLLAKLADKGIRVIITPISWWGSGYPEPDPEEPGFSSNYSKAEMNQDPHAIAAQQRYLKQFFSHVNPHNMLKYGQDPNVLAIELFNEPHHKDMLKGNETYIEGLVKVLRDLGIKKPLFYNISEQGNSPDFARRLCSTSIQGIAYQWYPTGLVKNSESAANMLATVAHYTDPFANINECQTKAKMIYEFDAADIATPIMYPAMARSFKEAGFQWATQFSYDPVAIADTNSDYNTHYLNLLYTPSKAISFLIAAEVFRQIPRLQKQADYPANNHFSTAQGKVSLDYHQDLSVLNSPSQFLYSNTTQIQAEDEAQLQQIAGVGSSPLVNYSGSGAYFLDKLKSGQWRLEVYPDVLPLQDPYQSASLKREVRRLYQQSQNMSINLRDLGKAFWVTGLNNGNTLNIKAQKATFKLLPGVYLLSKNSAQKVDLATVDHSYYLPALPKTKLAVFHQVQREWSVSDSVSFDVEVGSEQAPDKVSLLIKYRGHKNFSELEMQRAAGNHYHLTLPTKTAKWSATGQLEYAFVVSSEGQSRTFPGDAAGSPIEWDFVALLPFWQTELRASGAPVTLFDAKADRDSLVYPNSATSRWEYVIGQQSQGLALRLSSENLTHHSNETHPLVRMTLAVDNQLKNRNLNGYNTVAIKVRALQQTEYVQFSLLDADGLAKGRELEVSTNWHYLVVPLTSLVERDTLFPKSYPMFMPAVYSATKTTVQSPLNLLQGLQFAFSSNKYPPNIRKGWHAIEIAELKLLKQ